MKHDALRAGIVDDAKGGADHVAAAATVSRRPVCGSSRGSRASASLEHAALRPVPHHAARDRGRGAWASRPTKSAALRGAPGSSRIRMRARSCAGWPGNTCGGSRPARRCGDGTWW